MLEQSILQNYLDILREELVPATGCTEPIAIAYCAATLRELLGALPERVDAAVSGNILKNVKSVVVPNTGGRKGIAPAIAVGLVAGDASRDAAGHLRRATEEPGLAESGRLPPAGGYFRLVQPLSLQLDIDLRGSCGGHTARVRITNHPQNIVCLERDGEVLLASFPLSDSAEEHRADKSLLPWRTSCALRPRCRSTALLGPCWSRRSAATPPLPRRASAAHGARRVGLHCYWSELRG